MYIFVLGFTGIFLDGFPNFVRSALPMEQLLINYVGVLVWQTVVMHVQSVTVVLWCYKQNTPHTGSSHVSLLTAYPTDTAP